MDNLLQDIRYGLRLLRRSPGFTAVAVITLTLGIAANTTIFSVMNATILKTPSFPNPDRLAVVWTTFGPGPDNESLVSAPIYRDFRRSNHSFEDLALFDSAGRGYNLAAIGSSREPEQVSGLRVSANFFTVLGVRPMLGRTFVAEEETRGKDREVVLSYGLWKRRYGGDPGLVGRTIKVDGEDFAVVGVMPREFRFQFESDQRQLWVPVGYTDGDPGSGAFSFIAFGRLKPGVSVARARAEMETIATRLSKEHPEENAGRGAAVMIMGDYGLRDLRTIMWALLAAVGFVLLIACVNIANLLLARGAARRKELALRRALGASATRIARQLLTESMLLALLGGLGGIILSAWSTSFLPAILPDEAIHVPLRPLESIAVDGRVLVFAFLVSCLTGILFGLAPAVSVLRRDVAEPLKEGGRGSRGGASARLRHILVASEVALALVVLCGAGLMIESMARLLGVDPGFKPKNVLTMEMSLPQAELYSGPPGLPRFCRDIADRVGAIPGVVSVGAVAHLPLLGTAGRSFAIEGRPDPGPENRANAHYSVACPNYFATMGVPVLEGREFTDQDTVGTPDVIVINQAMARKYWPGEDPIGKRIQCESWFTVVGVVRDVRHWGLDADVRPEFFRAYTQAAWPWMRVVVRTATAPGAYSATIRKALFEVAPDRPVSDTATMDRIVEDSLGSRRFPAVLLAGFSLLALVLASVGIIGVVSYAVTQRSREIGIRMALGASPREMSQLMVRGSMTWVLVGIALGIGGSLGLTRLLGALLFGVKPTNPVVLAAVSLLLGAVALLSSYVPARRAANVDPTVALRAE